MTSATELLRRQPRKPRYQSGTIYESSGRFYVKYRAVIDGKRERVSKFLCERDDQHPRATARSVKLIRDQVMSEVNNGAVEIVAGATTIAAFWENVYLPHVRQHKRPATVAGYVHIWKRWLKPHFGDAALNEYLTETATEFLTKLSSKLGRNSYNHVRSLMSGIFSHAIAVGKVKYGIASNPIHDAHSLGKMREPKPTEWYTLPEALDILKRLDDHLQAQTIFALAFFAGLRPSEIVGLRREDFDAEARVLNIQRACVRGVVGDTKTPESAAPVPLIPQCFALVKLWLRQSEARGSVWMFPNESGAKPLDLRDYTRKVFAPVLGDRWRGLYSARRGAGTVLVDLTGNLVATQELLRHKSMVTTAMHYKKRTANALPGGMKLLEAEARKTERE